MTSRLRGKRALVTGGGSGIGRGASIRLAEEGAVVGVLDVNLDAARETVQLVEAGGGTARAVQADVSLEPQVAEAIDAVATYFGGLDTIVANAGIMLFGRDTIASELDLKTWQQSLDVNLTGIFLTCKYGLRELLKNGGGSIVITSSPTGAYGCAPTFTAYSASKAGTFGLMRILAVDYAKRNIRVNAVLPGTTNSPLVTTILDDPSARAEFLAKIPMGRAADTREIGNIIAFLASDEASYVTGAGWYADGGLTGI